MNEVGFLFVAECSQERKTYTTIAFEGLNGFAFG